MSITMTWSVANLKVRPVSSATPIVAVKPGSIPMIMPKPVAQKALKSVSGVISFINSVKNAIKFIRLTS